MNHGNPDPLDALLHPAGWSNDANYLRAVTQMADEQEVVAGESIYSDSGIKLIDKGARIDTHLYDRLMQHRLSAPIDAHLMARAFVDVATIEAEVMRQSGSGPLGRLIVQRLGAQQYVLLEVLRRMQWPQAVSFKMTVMRSQRPQLYEHSVMMMMVAVFLAHRQGLSMEECADVAAAAMLHDVGMLFMPPSWTDAAHKLTPQERKHLAAHSITALLVVRSAQVYPRVVEEAVLEHHERLDGSGYPRQLKGSEISPMGRILMLAEVVSAFYGKFSDMPAQRLSLVLRMNHNRFDAKLTEMVYQLLGKDSTEHRALQTHSSGDVHQVIAILGAVFQHWVQCKRKFPEKWQSLPGGRAALYVDLRMAALEKSLAESGSHPRQQADWLAMFEEDPTSMTELVLINREALWQIDSCVENCLRRWPQPVAPQGALSEHLYDWLNACRTVLHDAHAPRAEAMA